MPRPLPRLVPSPPRPFLSQPSISGARIAHGFSRFARFALISTVWFVTQHVVNTKFEKPLTSVRWLESAQAGRYCDTPLTGLSSSQSPPRHCFIMTESITTSVRTSSIVPATANLIEQSFVA